MNLKLKITLLATGGARGEGFLGGALQYIKFILFFGIFFSFGLGWGKTLDKPPTLAAPDERGPYNVGTTTFCATMTDGRTTRIQVYYPTLEPEDCESKYTIFPPVNQSNPAGSCLTGGLFDIMSSNCAVHDAIPAAESFPFIARDHGGSPAGNDPQRIQQAPLDEVLASHGFIVAVAVHSGDAVVRLHDLSLLIDIMLGRSESPGDLFYQRINDKRIGVTGISTGGLTALRAAAGLSASGIEKDSRVKAMAVYEPDILSNSDVPNLTIPYLIMGGDQFRLGDVAIRPLFDATINALPRIYVFTADALHLSYQTGVCNLNEGAREFALTADPSLVEPLTNFNNATPRACNTNIVVDPNIDPLLVPGIRAASLQACQSWNGGEFQVPPNRPGFGGGRNFCNRLGVNSVSSLDKLPEDGFTDEPPFVSHDFVNDFRATLPAEVTTRLMTLYTVAFFKKFLAHDGRYMSYLKQKYADENDLPAIIDLRD